MRRTALLGILLLAPTLTFAKNHFTLGFGNTTVSGFITGEVFLSGGGSYDPSTGFVHAAGGFRCLKAVGQGPLNGCDEGQGVRWDTEELLPFTMFKCTGAATETNKRAETNDHTAVLRSDFYRASDGNDESFRAAVIIADHDIAPDIDGLQNIWIQGVGCGTMGGSFTQH
jgi:hypothetical protein